MSSSRCPCVRQRDAGASRLYPTNPSARDRPWPPPHAHEHPRRISQTSEVEQAPRPHPQTGSIQVVDVKFCDLPGHLAALLHPGERRWTRTCSARGWASTARRSAAFRRSTRATCCCCRTSDERVRGSGARGADALAHLRHLRPDHAGAVLPRPALHRVQGRGVSEDDRHRHDVVLGARGRVLHLQLRALRPERARGLLPHRLRRGHLELGPQRHARTSGTGPRHKEGYFPVPPVDRLQDVRSKIMLALIEAGIPVEVQHHEVATAGQAEIDIRFGTLVQTADRLHDLQVHRQERLPQPRLHGHVHAQAAVRRQRLGHARATSRCGTGDSPLFFDENGYALLSETARHYIGGLIKHAPGAAGALRPDDQQLPPAGAGLRGAGQPDVLGAQPVGDLPDPDVLEHRPRPSGSSSGRRIRRPTRTWPSRRC